MRVLDSGEVLWWSQRDGWGHLYLYSADGGRVERVTGGRWLVHRVLWVDEDSRRVWFLACGLHADDPYVRQVCRVDLDGGGFVRLTDDDLDRIVDTSWDPPVTLGVRLISVLSDDLQHAGQAAFVRGVLERRRGR